MIHVICAKVLGQCRQVLFTCIRAHAKAYVPDVPFLNVLPLSAKLSDHSPCFGEAPLRSTIQRADLCLNPACFRTPWCYWEMEIDHLLTDMVRRVEPKRLVGCLS